MQKLKKQYICEACGSEHPKWGGQCGECGKWNCLQEVVISQAVRGRQESWTGERSQPIALKSVQATEKARFLTGISELDRVLGGGLVGGSVILIGGDPGIGKSTLLLDALGRQSHKCRVLYVTGEESLQQVSTRAQRLKLHAEDLTLLAETEVGRILEILQKLQPEMVVIDSIQTLFTEVLPAAPGSVSQIRESAAKLVEFAKKTNTTLFLVGHVTKEGTLAGPRVLEHMVDTVLYFEGQADSRYRILRAVKNRFGAVNELGVFAMTDQGLKEVSNPSALFLSRYEVAVPGSMVMVTWEGTRPLLVEVQALVDGSYLGNHCRNN